MIIFFIGFVATYIQGNFMVGSLPTVDGASINWANYTKMNVISVVLWLALSILTIFLYKKFKNNFNSIVKYASLAIFAMLIVSLTSVLITKKEMYADKGTIGITMENFNKLSYDKNFLILLVDMEDSKTFDKVLKDMNKEDLFKDFTYFPDTLGAYPYTRESIPFVLSGNWYESGISFGDYYNETMDNSKLIETLKQKNYDINIYESELLWNTQKALQVNNVNLVNFKLDKKIYIKQECKYLLYKYLPFPLKKYSRIESFNLINTRTTEYDFQIFNPDNKFVYDNLNNKELQKQNYFHFLHIDGGHFPWNLNADVEEIGGGTYEDKVASSITVIDKYISKIKESGQYDNSVIVVLADHGLNGYEYVGRQNPILYVKGINETHKKMIVSNKKVSFVDLNDSIYFDLLDGKKSTELLSDVKNNRKRRFLWYKDYDYLYEQILDGHAWETNKLKDTGTKYKR